MVAMAALIHVRTKSGWRCLVKHRWPCRRNLERRLLLTTLLLDLAAAAEGGTKGEGHGTGEAPRHGTPGSIEVSVRGAPAGMPIVGLAVRLLPSNAVSATDTRGRVSIPDVRAGLYTLVAHLDGFSIRTVSLAVLPGRPTEVALVAEPDAKAALSAVDRARELTLFLAETGRLRETVEVLDTAETTTLGPGPTEVPTQRVAETAGGAENVFRVVGLLPGVVGANEFQSRLAVRGGGPDQNLTLLDGVEIHNPYRLEGLVSAFNPETVKDFSFDPVPLHARYGDRLSSVLVVRGRDGTRERGLAGSAGASLTDANVVLEGRLPWGAKSSWLLTGRQTYYDVVAERFVHRGNLPGFRDLQFKASWNPLPSVQLSLFGLRSRENGEENEREDPRFEKRGFKFGVHNDVLGLSLDWFAGSRIASATSLSAYWNASAFNFTYADDAIDLQRSSSIRDLAVRQEVRFDVGPRHVIETGFDVHGLDTAWKMSGSGLGLRPIRRVGVGVWGDGLVTPVDSRLQPTRGAGWLSYGGAAPGRVAVELGGRLEWNTFNRETLFLPRARVTRPLGTSARAWVGIGWFSQSPGYEKLLQSDYFLDLGAAKPAPANERSFQAVIGFSRDFGMGLGLRIEAYHKRLSRLLVGRLETGEDRQQRLARFEIPSDYPGGPLTERQVTTYPTNDGSGRSHGIELLFQRRSSSPETRLTGWASYSFARSERTAYGRTLPSDHDRRHAFNLVANFQMKPRFRLSAAWQLASGFPYTPVVPDVEFSQDEFDADDDGNRDEWRPVRWFGGAFLTTVADVLLSPSQINSRRLPVYSRLDLRASYSPHWGNGRWEFYLDVINVLNRENTIYIDSEQVPGSASGPSDVRFEEKRIKSLPIIPSFGVRLRF